MLSVSLNMKILINKLTEYGRKITIFVLSAVWRRKSAVLKLCKFPNLSIRCSISQDNNTSSVPKMKCIISRKKEFIWISSDEMDETGANYTEWSKPERKTPIQYTNTYIWNLGRWQWRPCMQDMERDTDVYNGLLDSEGGRGWDDLGEWHSNMYTIM